MMSRCRTIEEAIAGIRTVEELDAFIATLRDPPPGVVVKECTREQWAKIAHRRISLKREEEKWRTA